MSRTLLFTTLATPLLLLATAQAAAAAPAPAFARPVVASAGHDLAAAPAGVVVPAPTPTVGAAAAAAAAKKYKNCAALNATYPHGVAKAGAADKVRGATKPVTTFKIAPKVYAANTHLDRDKDGVACEKR